MDRKINIAIDGYSSCGKSTLAKGLAKALGYSYIDSGAMYRAVTLYAIRNKLTRNAEVKEQGLIAALSSIDVDFINKNGVNTTRLNREEVEDEIRTLEVSSLVSQVSRIPEVRGKLRVMQQRTAEKGGVVMDGRDIGSAVLPNAELKIFMTADPEVRVERRFAELKAKGEQLTRDEVRENLTHRDQMDTNRKENPLIQTTDARVLDNTNLTPLEQLELVIAWAHSFIKA
ncbi:(d)CMP kinase [Cryomorphaceae bacterium 1068]|nr:(d)CMP kinase [Cryomorphaceae bacterium 1068]